MARPSHIQYYQTIYITSLAIPALATGVGGLSWKDVEPLIEQSLGDLSIPIYVYSVYHSGQQAVEPA